MTRPKAYDPQQGYKYQIFVRFPQSREYEHCDYAIDKQEKDYLLREYALAYRSSHPEFKVIICPQKYWLKETIQRMIEAKRLKIQQ